MNLFVLFSSDDDDDEQQQQQQHMQNAKFHVDSHVSKMILESAQILSTVHRELDDIDNIAGVPIYKATHVHHPCVKWVMKTLGNYHWTTNYLYALAMEHAYRKGTIHRSFEQLWGVFSTFPPKNIDSSLERTPFALAMPEKYRGVSDSAVESYRAYYNGEKRHLFSWTKRNIPYWIET